MSFGEFAEGFWDKNSEYVQYRNSRTDITDSYLASCRSLTENQLIPFFGGVPLDKITAADVNKTSTSDAAERMIFVYSTEYVFFFFITISTYREVLIKSSSIARK
jgi:hypothetical protein